MLVHSESFFGRREDWTGTVLYDAPLCRFKEIGTKNVLEREIHKAALTHSIDSDHK